MKITHIVAAVSAAATIATSAASCTPAPNSPPPSSLVPPVSPTTPVSPPRGTVRVLHVSDYGLSFTADCGAGSAVLAVTPDNPITRATAAKACAQSNGVIDTAPWPSGVHPIPSGGEWGG